MRRSLYFLPMILIVFLAGCHVVGYEKETEAKSPQPKILPGVASLSGSIVDINDQPLGETPVHFAEVYRDNGSAAFIYDASNSPSVISGQDGRFAISDLSAGEFVIIVGDPMLDYAIINAADGTPEIYVVQGDTTMDLGKLTIQYK